MIQPNVKLELTHNTQFTVQVVDNGRGVVVELTGPDIKAALMWSPTCDERVTFIDKNPIMVFQCHSCKAQFSHNEECDYCPECGHDEVVYLLDIEEE